jgi:hypothetical protein
MSSNTWAVLNNVDDEGKLKPKKKPAVSNKAKSAAKTQQKPQAGSSSKPQLTAKAARAFQQPKQQPKKPAAAAAPAPVAAKPAAAIQVASSSSSSGAAKKGAAVPAPQAKPQAPAMVVKAAAPIQVRAHTAPPPSINKTEKLRSLQFKFNARLAPNSSELWAIRPRGIHFECHLRSAERDRFSFVSFQLDPFYKFHFIFYLASALVAFRSLLFFARAHNHKLISLLSALGVMICCAAVRTVGPVGP